MFSNNLISKIPKSVTVKKGVNIGQA